MISNSAEIDESLYSRQLYVMGHEAQKRMGLSSVLIIGLNGLGVEVAKNVILAGVKSVALYDAKEVTYTDLSSQFYLTENDIGKNRALVSGPKLAELNPYVQVYILDELNTSEFKDKFTVVVLIDVVASKRVELADKCHNLGVSVVCGDTYGVFCNIFCDFGESFIVNDVDGEPAFSSMIASVTNDTRALVTVLEDTRHNLVTGDIVCLTDVKGMELLNNQQFTVDVIDPYSFTINYDTTSLGAYSSSGYVNQIKQPNTISFQSYSQSITSPGEIFVDFSKMHLVHYLHIAFQALDSFHEDYGYLPESGNIIHAEEVVKRAMALKPELFELDDNKLSEEELKYERDKLDTVKKIVLRLALCSRGQCGPINAYLGGILGQEVLKACSGKFMPIKQWFYFDAIEALSDDILSVDEVTPLNCRYDGQIMIFGRKMQSILSTLNMFLVGAGAIGCEMIKNWAMMGVSCSNVEALEAIHPSSNGRRGVIHTTDMDKIEKSNLSRQFLFRNSDINHPKSTTAIRAVKVMNPQLNGIAHEDKVAIETESIFNDDFYESLDYVCTALDNVEARLYIDQKCLFYHKPMLESGTLGAKGHTQVVAPFKTENYGATRDPPEKSIPSCTLKFFPNQIEHTLQWARDWFEEVYGMGPNDANQYLATPDYAINNSLAVQQNMRLETLTRIKSVLVDDRPTSIEDCIAWSRNVFEDLFANKVKQLLHSFSPDYKTKDGLPFWSGAKKAPSPIEFNPYDELHVEFILTSANLRASLYGISPCLHANQVASIAATVKVEKFQPKDGIKIATTEEEAKAESISSLPVDIDQQCSDILRNLPHPSQLVNFKVTPVEFDKDIDEQMRVVAAASNLRAVNYGIIIADLYKSRGIAGKITPAIATTTAMVSAAICLELYKLIQDKPIEQLRNTFTNLALPLFTSCEPDPPKYTKSIIKGKEWKWTQWDRIDVSDPSLTIDGLCELLENDYGVELSMLSCGVTILFSDFMERKKMAERRKMTLKAVVEAVTKKMIPVEQKYVIFEIIVTDRDTQDEVEIPYLRYKLF